MVTGGASGLGLAAAGMGRDGPVDGDRGACVLTALIADYEGQIPYAASTAGVIGTPILARMPVAG